MVWGVIKDELFNESPVDSSSGKYLNQVDMSGKVIFRTDTII